MLVLLAAPAREVSVVTTFRATSFGARQSVQTTWRVVRPPLAQAVSYVITPSGATAGFQCCRAGSGFKRSTLVREWTCTSFHILILLGKLAYPQGNMSSSSIMRGPHPPKQNKTKKIAQGKGAVKNRSWGPGNVLSRSQAVLASEVELTPRKMPPGAKHLLTIESTPNNGSIPN